MYTGFKYILPLLQRFLRYILVNLYLLGLIDINMKEDL